MKIDLHPFSTPNYVMGKVPPRTRQEGMQNQPTWHLADVDADTLSQMCDDFRADVFRKAGKHDPKAEPHE